MNSQGLNGQLGDEILLPEVITEAGPVAAEAFVEFFTASIRSGNTRAAYARAIARFFRWCSIQGLALEQLHTVHIATYVESHTGSPATVKQHLAAIRRLFDRMVVRHALDTNPAVSVRGPRAATKASHEGLTPILVDDEPRLLLEVCDIETLAGLRDRAILATMLYTFARVSAVALLRIKDYYQRGRRGYLCLREKNERRIDMPVHHKLEEYLDAYLEAADISGDREGPLFRPTDHPRHPELLKPHAMARELILSMIKRRAVAAGFGERRKAPSGGILYDSALGCHSLRGTGITRYLENGGQLEDARYMAGHRSPRTTMLYDRRRAAVSPSEVERISY